MTLYKYMDPMLLLQNQLINPILWNPVPFLLYLHFCLGCRLFPAEVKGLLDPPPTLLNRIHIRACRRCGIKIIPCAVRHLAQQLRFDLWP
jgi:hypothetical protein